jgi:hypothetical protein
MKLIDDLPKSKHPDLQRYSAPANGRLNFFLMRLFSLQFDLQQYI